MENELVTMLIIHSSYTEFISSLII